MFEIAIDELGIGNDRTAYVMLPANKNEIIDAMDSARIFGETFVRIERCDKFPELNGFEFSEEPTLDELNFLAKRLEEISADKEDITAEIAYKALLRKPMDTISEAINRTYNLETIPVYPCKNVYAYGEIVLENEMLEELHDVPDEIYDWLDPDKVGRAMMEREGGAFINGYYVVADSYEPALVYDEELPEPQDDWVFRLEVAGVPNKPEDFSRMKTETLTLPANEEYMQDIAEYLGERSIDVCNCMNFKSAIPQIKDDCFESMEDIYALNNIAWKFTELSREDTAKFKAVLQSESWNSISEAEDILKNLGGYNFDNTVTDSSDFGRKYLSEMLPPDFDRSFLEGINAAELAKNVLHINGGSITTYGAVSEYGGQLYSMVEVPEQEQCADFRMGGNFVKYQIKCAEPEQHSMFYSDCDPALRNACVGHVRMDFGSGNEFYSTWWGNRNDLNTEQFRTELDDVINELRGGLLKNRIGMQRYCSHNQSLNLNESYGFSVETDVHLYLLRCRPEQGNYDCYCYCYDKHELQLAQAQEQNETLSQGMSL